MFGRESSSFERVWTKDCALVLLSLLVVSIASWVYMVHEARAGLVNGVCQCLGATFGAADSSGWGMLEGSLLFLMWAEMMAAMMTPTVAPAVLLFAALHRRRTPNRTPFGPTGFFVLGYLAIWTAFSFGATLLQWRLQAGALMSSRWSLTSEPIGGLVLMAAGAFQATSFKRTCLLQCRSPLQFFTVHWKEGLGGAFSMGSTHGAYCLGCCWMLMAILFVVGIMNLFWIAVITLFVLAEKIAPRPLASSGVAGIALVLWGAILVVKSLIRA